MSESDKVLYTAKSHTTGGRDGGAGRTSDGRVDVKFSTPGGAGTGTNPEQLFALGWSACYIGALRHVAGQKKIRFPEGTAVDAEVDLRRGDDGFSIAARLNVSLPGLAQDVAQDMANTAHTVCPYSKATHGNINVVTTVST